jgi:uncharacterized delta-60 repeat protein
MNLLPISDRFLRKVVAACLGCSVLMLWMVAATANAAPGELDTSLGGDGKILGGWGGGDDDGTAIAVQADGKIVVAGTGTAMIYNFINLTTRPGFVLSRYLPDGTPDPSFGEKNGQLSVSTGVGSMTTSVAVQADGKILVAGHESLSGTQEITLRRFLPDGLPDNSFDGDGIAKPLNGVDSRANAMLVLPDRIIVGGQVGSNFSVIAVTSSGAVDTAFGGGDGIANIAFSGFAKALAFQSPGRIVATGGTNGINDSSVAVVRLDSATGNLDPTFDSDGIVATSLGSVTEYGVAVRIQPGNNTILNVDEIVVAGVSDGLVTVLRYQLNGALDPSLDTDGILQLPLAAGSVTLSSLYIQTAVGGAASRIVVGGHVGNAGSRDFLVVRLLLNGVLDTTFDLDGLVTTAIGPADDLGHAMVIQSGKIVLAGTAVADSNSTSNDIAVVRYNLSNGSLDTTLDGDGKLTDDIYDLPSVARSVAVQPDGKIVVVGNNEFGFWSAGGLGVPGFAVPGGNLVAARYHPDGTPDRGFGKDGVVFVLGGSTMRATGVALQADGKIVMSAGWAIGGGFAAVRLDAAGILDPDFGNAGIAGVDVSGGFQLAEVLALQADGNIVLAGYADTGTSASPNRDFALVRLTAAGQPDSTFSGDGKLTTNVPGQDTIKAVMVQPDDGIVVAGFGSTATGQDLAVARYGSTGLPDFTFAGSGRLTLDLGGATDCAYSLRMQGDKILLAGSGGNMVFVARLNAVGSFDGTFSGGGLAFSGPSGSGASTAMGLQGDGKLMVGGNSAPGIFSAFRFSGNGMVDANYGTAGIAAVDFQPLSGPAQGLSLDGTGRVVLVGQAGGRVAITRLQADAPLLITSIGRIGNKVRLEGLFMPGALVAIEASPDLGAGSFGAIGTAAAGPDSRWSFEETVSAAAGRRFYRASVP